MKKVRSFSYLFLVLLLVSCSACQSVNPLAQAETHSQRAYALYGTYVIFVEKAADLAEDPRVSPLVKLRLIGAEERISPLIDSLLIALREYEHLRTQENNTEKLLVLAENLEEIITKTAPLVEILITNVRGVQL